DLDGAVLGDRALACKQRRDGEQRRTCGSQSFHGSPPPEVLSDFRISCWWSSLTCSIRCATRHRRAAERSVRTAVDPRARENLPHRSMQVLIIHLETIAETTSCSKTRRRRRNVAQRAKPKPTRRLLRKGRIGELRRPRKPSPIGSRRKTGAGRNIFSGLRPNAANFAPLTPVSFLP